MRLLALTIPTLGLLLVGASGGAVPSRPAPSCLSVDRSEETVTVLRTYAAAYHAESLREARRGSYETIGFLLDTECRIRGHASTTRPADSLDVETALTGMFPSRPRGRLLIGGIAEAVVPSGHGAGRPWIVWAVFAE